MSLTTAQTEFLQTVLVQALAKRLPDWLSALNPQCLTDMLFSVDCPACGRERCAAYVRGGVTIYCRECAAVTPLLDALREPGATDGQVFDALCNHAGLPSRAAALNNPSVVFSDCRDALAKDDWIVATLAALGIPSTGITLGYIPYLGNHHPLHAYSKRLVLPWFDGRDMQLFSYRPLSRNRLSIDREAFWHRRAIAPCFINHPANRDLMDYWMVSDPLLAACLLAAGLPAVAIGYLTRSACLRHAAETGANFRLIAGPDEKELVAQVKRELSRVEVITIQHNTNAKISPIQFGAIVGHITANATQPSLPNTAQSTPEIKQRDAILIAAELLREGYSVEQSIQRAGMVAGVSFSFVWQ